MGLTEWGATVFSLIYLAFAIYNKPVCFVFGMIGSAIWAVVSFNAGLMFDAGLQIFYIIISGIGIYQWKFGGYEKSELPITRLRLQQHILIIAIGIICSIALIQASGFFTFINLPILDATTTVFLIIGTLLLIKRKLSSWIYLVVADLFYLYIYGVVGLWLLVGVMIAYIVFGIFGYLNWLKMTSKEEYISPNLA